MSIKSVKAYANFPIRLRIEKDRYWYVNELVSVNKNTTIVKNLDLFEGFGYELSSNIMSSSKVCPPKITFQEGLLWDYSSFNGGSGALAPKGKNYYLSRHIFDNVSQNGAPVVSDFGIYSDISAENNLYTTFNPGSNSWKISMWVHTPLEGFADGQCLFGPYSTACAAPKLCVDSANQLVLSLASSTSEYDIANEVLSLQKLSPDQDYLISLEFDGEKYVVKAGYNSDTTQGFVENVYIELVNSVCVYGTSNQFCIGYCCDGLAWGGTIDLSRFEIFINGVLSWRPYHLISTVGEGILDVTEDNGAAAEYSVFVKNDGEIELSLSDEDKEGYYWAGTISVPAHPVYTLFQAYFDIVGTVTITDNLVSGFSSSNYLRFDFDKLSDYFSQPCSVLSKFTYSSASSTQGCLYCAANGRQLFMVSSGKIALNDGSVRTGIALTNGKTYWVFGNYVLDDGYSLYIIEDDGYTEETLPDISEWTFVYKTTVSMFSNGEYWIGKNPSNQYIRGNIDLGHTCIKIGDTVVWKPFEKIS